MVVGGLLGLVATWVNTSWLLLAHGNVSALVFALEDHGLLLDEVWVEAVGGGDVDHRVGVGQWLCFGKGGGG